MFKTVALVSFFSFGLNLPHMAARMDGFVNGWKFTTSRGKLNLSPGLSSLNSRYTWLYCFFAFLTLASGWREMNWLMLLNHGMHMPIYCISGPWFRKEMKKMLCRPCLSQLDSDQSLSTASTSNSQSTTKWSSEKDGEGQSKHWSFNSPANQTGTDTEKVNNASRMTEIHFHKDQILARSWQSHAWQCLHCWWPVWDVDIGST